jgi:hypothetical protein
VKRLNTLKIFILVVALTLLVGNQFSTAQAELEHHVQVYYNPMEHLDTVWFGIRLRGWEPQSNVTINVYNNEFDTIHIAGPYHGKISDNGTLGFGEYRHDLDITKITYGKYIVVENEFHTTEGFIPKLKIEDVNYATSCITLTGEQGKHLWFDYQLNENLVPGNYLEILDDDSWTKCFSIINDGATIGEQTWFDTEIRDEDKSISYLVSYPSMWGSLNDPLFEAHPSLDWIMVSEIPVGTRIFLEVWEDSISGNRLFYRELFAQELGLNKLKGTAQFYLWEEIDGQTLDLLPSHYITIKLGEPGEEITKQIFGQELTYEVLDLENGIISGTGPAGEVIVLEFLYYPEIPVYGPVVIKPDGTWLHEFEVPETDPLPPDAWGTIEYWSPNSDGGIFINSSNYPPTADAGGPYLGALNTQIHFNGTGSSDPDNNTLTYFWDFGDTNSAFGATPTHSYVEVGIYDVCLTLNDGIVDSDPDCTFAVVYDPEGGFVTGGGWIDSQPGAYLPDLTLTGKASFGFVSKYKKGASVPTGNTEFQFKVADLNFHSSSYQWLVVTGSDYARFKGTGTINGVGEYKFMIWAGDGDTDTFRIKIWEEDELGVETVIYDNGSDQAIDGGSIVVHTRK